MVTRQNLELSVGVMRAIAKGLGVTADALNDAAEKSRSKAESEPAAEPVYEWVHDTEPTAEPERTMAEAQGETEQIEAEAQPEPEQPAVTARPAEPEAEPAKSKSATETVLEIIRKAKKPVRREALVAETGFEKPKLDNILFRLKKANKVKMPQRGTYEKA